VNAAFQGSPRMPHACYRFASPDLEVLRILNYFFHYHFDHVRFFLSLKMLALVRRPIYFPLLTVVYTTAVPCVTR